MASALVAQSRYVECPACRRYIAKVFINEHLDTCLRASSNALPSGLASSAIIPSAPSSAPVCIFTLSHEPETHLWILIRGLQLPQRWQQELGCRDGFFGMSFRGEASGLANGHITSCMLEVFADTTRNWRNRTREQAGVKEFIMECSVHGVRDARQQTEDDIKLQCTMQPVRGAWGAGTPLPPSFDFCLSAHERGGTTPVVATEGSSRRAGIFDGPRVVQYAACCARPQQASYRVQIVAWDDHMDDESEMCSD